MTELDTDHFDDTPVPPLSIETVIQQLLLLENRGARTKTPLFVRFRLKDGTSHLGLIGQVLHIESAGSNKTATELLVHAL